jgi:hypothetical protein
LRLHFGNLSEDQGGPPKLEKWKRLHSPSSRLSYLLVGLIGLMVPNLFCVWLIFTSVLAEQNKGGETVVDTSTPWGAVLLALLLFIPLHELLHVVWHPQLGLSPRTVLVIWPRKLRFGVYYEGSMTRRQWLFMRITPLMVLTVIPVGLLTLFRYLPVPFALETFLQVMMLVNGIGSGGDVVAVIWVLFQIPSKSQIGFFGGKAYWRSVPVPRHALTPSS